MSTKCIICYTELPQWSPKKPPDILTSSLLLSEGQVPETDLLSKHLDVIFILRNIFEVPLDQLSFYLRHCPSIENWITTCTKCEKLVQDFGVIYRKGQEVKRRLIQIVKETYDKDRDDHEIQMHVALDITEKCRQFIREYNYEGITNPFIEGDLRARELLKSKEVKINQDHLKEIIEVKEELPELLHLSQNMNELLNDFLLDPEPVNIPIVNSSSPLNDDDDNDHWNEDVEMVENQDLFKTQPMEEPTSTTEVPPPQPQLPIIPSKPTRKLVPRVAKRIAKTKTKSLLRKLEKPLFPPKRVKPPKKLKTTDKPKRRRGRPRKYFTLENPAPVFKPEEPDLESEPEQVDQTRPDDPVPVPESEPVDHHEESRPKPPPGKYFFKDDSEEEEDIPKYYESRDDDFEISDIEAAEESSDFETSEDEEKPKKYKKKERKSDTNPKPKASTKLKCPEAECSAEFDKRQELNAHLLEVHNTSPKPPVIRPRKYTEDCYSYSENRKRRFRVKIDSKCELCLKTFKNPDSLRAHMRLMDELRWPHHCKICGKGDTSKASMEKHEALCETGEALLTLVTCPVEGCGLILKTTVVLETHYRHHHRDLEQQPCRMDNCQEKFFTKEGLDIHLREKHKEDLPFICDHCNQGFPTKSKMEVHRKRTLEREAVEKDPSLAKICNDCGKTFVNELGLRFHVSRVHENKFLYTCEHCGKGEMSQDHMNIHLWRVHERRDVTLKWRCEVEGCERICRSKRQFEAHKARHAGSPQFCCEECGKEFYDKQHLREHISAMHESKKKGEKVKCEICGMEFGYWKYMIRHKRTVHENKKRRPKNKPKKTDGVEMREEQNVGAGGGKEEVFMAAGQQFNLQIL